MLSIQQVADEFKMGKGELIQKSVKLFLKQQLIEIEADLFKYSKKYGVKNVFEMDEKLKNGSLRENDVIDDFFVIDRLEHERERLVTLLKDFDNND